MIAETAPIWKLIRR